MNRPGALPLRAEGDAAEITIELAVEPGPEEPLDSQRGVLMALLDRAMVQAAASRIGFVREAVSVDLHVAFVHPLVVRPASGRLTARARACGGGKSVCFCEAEASNADGKVVARALGTFRYRKG